MAYSILKSCYTCGKEALHINGCCVSCDEKKKEQWINKTSEEKFSDLLYRVEGLESKLN